MTVAVIADGGVSLPVDLAPAQVHVVEMRLRQLAVVGVAAGGSSPVREGTAAPSPGDFLAAIERADESDGVLVVTVTARLSASYSSAHLACAEAAPAHHVALVDSASATAGEGLVVLAAARAAATGAPLEMVAAAATAVRHRVRLVAQIASLDHLARGGRVPAVAAAGFRRTGMRPLFELGKGSIRPMRPAFSPAGAEERILAELRRSARPGVLHVAGLHAGDPSSAGRLLEGAARIAEPAERFCTELSPVMLAHTGDGVSGLAWWWET